MGVLYVVSANAVAHPGGSAKTILQLATSASIRAKIVEWGVTFNGTSSSATPATVLLQRQTNVGSGGQAITANYGPNNVDESLTSTAQSTALQGIWSTTEPTAGAVLCNPYEPPTSGMVLQYPLGQEPWIKVSGFLGIVVNVAAAVNINAWLKFEE